jgi:rhodanese-related sulfurtransferase
MSSVLSKPVTSSVLSTPPAASEVAVAHYSARLSFEADVSDVHADLHAGVPGFVLVDSRGDAAWRQGHIPQAIHLPTTEIADRAASVIPPGTVVVTYCWGPGCNGATRAALGFARLGYPVKEMIGGIEYWIREGFAVQGESGLETRRADPLKAPMNAITCDC